MTWIQTYTGRQFWPLEPRVEDIDIRDIAHALSMKCRYGGHSKQFYSVAQHSVLVARHASAEDALRALLHDAHEAYSPFGDVPRPIKQADPALSAAINKVEANLDRAIAAKFDLPWPIKNKAIDILDARILMDEREHVMAPSPHEWNIVAAPLGISIAQWSPEFAREKFLIDFHTYSAWNARFRGAA